MLRLMLNSHSRIAVPFESDFIPTTYRSLAGFGDLREAGNVAALLAHIGSNTFVVKGQLIPDPQAVLAEQPRSYAALVDAIFRVFARRHGKQRWGDKDPDNLCAMDLLWSLFPGCQFVHIVRDGRDVALSMRGLDWGTRHLPRLAHRWACDTIAARRMGGLLGERHYLEVRYEALVRTPGEQLERICSFLGEPFEPGMLDYHQQARQWMPESSLRYHGNSVSAPQPALADQWRHRMHAADVGIFAQYGGDALETFGYEVGDAGSRVSVGLRSAYYALVQRW
jgi:Sulfotransferase family